MKETISVKAMFQGTHCWPEAPQEVAFLRNQHRHLFIVSVKMGVTHSDRQLEFFIVARDLQKAIDVSYPHYSFEGMARDLGHSSCEMIAKEIILQMQEQGYNSTVSATVSEDGENESTVEM